MAGEFLDIPGNIKQIFLPFVLNSSQKQEYATYIQRFNGKQQILDKKYADETSKIIKESDETNVSNNITAILNELARSNDFQICIPLPKFVKSTNVIQDVLENKKTFISYYREKDSQQSEIKEVIEKVFDKYKDMDMSSAYSTKVGSLMMRDTCECDYVKYFLLLNAGSLASFSFIKPNRFYTWDELIKPIGKSNPEFPDKVKKQALSQQITLSQGTYKRLATMSSADSYLGILNNGLSEDFAFDMHMQIESGISKKKPICNIGKFKLRQSEGIAKKIAALWLERDRSEMLYESLFELQQKLLRARTEKVNKLLDKQNQEDMNIKQAREVHAGNYASQNIQVFTFKTNSQLNSPGWSYQDESAGYLKVLPNSFYLHSDSGKNRDQSFICITPNEEIYRSKKFDYIHSILNEAPSIIIREYLQDAKLNQVVTLFSEFGKAFMEQKDTKKRTNFLKELFGGVVNGLSTGKDLLFNVDKLVEYSFFDVLDQCKINLKNPDSYEDFVVRVPYMLYYQFLASTTTNIYEIPYNGKVIYTSNGSNGWKNGHLVNGASMNSGSSLVGGAIGKLVNYIGSNIRINTTPSWEGGDGDGMSLDVEFTLFNDSLDAALKNFIFVNTIVPGNMWMQYHVFQHAPDVYDISIEGVNRLFMCAANFNVDQVGVLRKPSTEFINILKKNHLNWRFKEKADDVQSMLGNIRIPDAYAVKCTFTSLLPNNFNNYLYRFWQTDRIIVPSIMNAHEDSMLNNVAYRFGKFMATVWDATANNDPKYKEDLKTKVFTVETSCDKQKKADMCKALDKIFDSMPNKTS